MSSNKASMSLDECIKLRKQSERKTNIRRGNGKFRGDGNKRGRFRRDRGDRRRNDGFRRDRRFRRDRDNYRRPRRSFDRRKRSDGDRSNGTRLFVKDLPKTVSNNDLRV